MPHPLHDPLKHRLYALTPRAFEFFAGDLLTFLGLDAVTVTRQTGDGGLDARCELVSGGVVRVPAGVQVKRLRQPVQRPDMDRFAGALTGAYACGIFITTAGFTANALVKANAIPHITPIDGDQVAAILLTQAVGIDPATGVLDEPYFAQFEAQAAGSPAKALAEAKPGYAAAPPVPDDLISLRALSYALHIDPKTVRGWVQRDLLQPDAGGGYTTDDHQTGLFFRRARLDAIRRQFRLAADPASAAGWTERFLHFAATGRLNKSYKPVLLLALLDTVNLDGEVPEPVLVEAFWDFYRQRAAAGLVAEVPASILSDPTAATPAQVAALIVRYPLDRFVIQGYLEHFPDLGLVRVRPEVWAGLTYRDVLALRAALAEQIARYYTALPG